MEAWFARWGLLAVLVGSATEGDLTLLLAGASCHLGLLRLPAVLLVGFVGSFASDVVVFALARARSERIRATALYRRTAPRLGAVIDRLGPWQILTARFAYGARLATMILWGIRGLSWPRFLPMAALGCAMWTLAMTLLGFASSRGVSKLLGEVERVELWLLGVLLAGLAVVVARRVRHRRGAAS